MYLALSREDAERIITDPQVYPFVRDDFSADPDSFVLPDEYIPLVVYDPGPVACVILNYRNGVTCEAHVQVRPESRSKSFIYGRAMLAWIWEEMAVDKIIAIIPANNRVVLHYVLRLGFKIEGRCSKSFKRDGKLIDMTYTGIERCQ